MHDPVTTSMRWEKSEGRRIHSLSYMLTSTINSLCCFLLCFSYGCTY